MMSGPGGNRLQGLTSPSGGWGWCPAVRRAQEAPEWAGRSVGSPGVSGFRLSCSSLQRPEGVGGREGGWLPGSFLSPAQWHCGRALGWDAGRHGSAVGGSPRMWS